MSIKKCNIDTAFKIAWAGFLHLEKITYTNVKLKKTAFANIHVTKSDISFMEGDQYAVFRLKRSKTNTKYSGVQIILATTGYSTCLVASLRHLFLTDPKSANAPLFCFNSGFFFCQSVITVL